jgi:hypothetical protein
MTTIVKEKYESDLDLITDAGTSLVGYVRCNTLATGLTVASTGNDAASGTLNTNIPFRVSSTKKYGIICRHIVIERLTTTDPVNLIERVRIPIFQPSVFVQYISQVGGSISYNGLSDWKLVGAQNERFHLFFSA